MTQEDKTAAFALWNEVQLGRATYGDFQDAIAASHRAGMIEGMRKAEGIAAVEFADSGWNGHYKNASRTIASAIATAIAEADGI